MKTFKSFISEAGPNVKPKAKGEADFVAAHEVEITDKTDQEQNSAKVATKEGSGKRKADRLDNKQAMGKDTDQADARKTTPSSKEAQQKVFDKHKERMKQLAKEEVELDEGYEKKVLDYLNRKGIEAEFVSGKLQVNKRDVAKTKAALSKASGFDASDLEVVAEAAYTNPGLEALAKKKKSLRQMKQEMAEADFSKKETKMAHTIGKEFEKKGVGDKTQGGPYAVASAMVRDKPEAAKKAYATIKAKMKEDISTEILFKLYEELNEENQEFFMMKLEEDAESLLDFAMSQVETE